MDIEFCLLGMLGYKRLPKLTSMHGIVAMISSNASSSKCHIMAVEGMFLPKY
nr:MAG TPA: hypothetical protein [Caudoviricetes sp.]